MRLHPKEVLQHYLLQSRAQEDKGVIRKVAETMVGGADALDICVKEGEVGGIAKNTPGAYPKLVTTPKEQPHSK